jgi:hypothetical protein
MKEIELHSFHLRRALKLAESSIAGMSDEHMTWAPQEKWSSANLLEHLSLGFLVTVKAGKMVLRQGGPELPKPTWRQRWYAIQVLELGHYPGLVIAPKMVRPRGLSPEEAKLAFVSTLQEMDQMLLVCEEKFGSTIKLLAHPYMGPLSIPQWRKFHLFHVRRHMRQLHRLRKQMETYPVNAVVPLGSITGLGGHSQPESAPAWQQNSGTGA